MAIDLLIFSDFKKKTMFRLLLLLVALVGATVAVNIACDTSRNYGGDQGAIYNDACPPERPYCTGSGLCSECALGKDPICDCPPNFKCAAARFNTVRNADFCAPMPLDVIDATCSDANQCDVQLVDQRTDANAIAFYTSCVANECRYCNGRSYSSTILCRQDKVPPGGDPRTWGSKADTARACLQAANAWNSYTETLTPPLPVDMYEYERDQYEGVTASPSGTVSPSAEPLAVALSPSPDPTQANAGTVTLVVSLVTLAVTVFICA